MGVVPSAWIVLRMSLLRYLRWRGYWSLTVGASLTLLTLTAGLCWLSVILPLVASSMPLEMALILLCCTPVLVVQRVVFHIFADRVRGEVLPDVYLTALHPLGIVVGRFVAVWLLAGVSLVCVLPACLMVMGLLGVSLMNAVGGVLLVWWMLLWLCASPLLPVQPTIPASPVAQGVQPNSATSQTAALERASDIARLMSGIAYSLTAYFMYRLTPQMQPILGSDLLSFVWGSVPYTCALGAIGASPAVVVSLLLFAPAWTVLMLVAAAQQVDWWSERAARFQRFYGAGVYYATVLWVLYLGLPVWVHTARDAHLAYSWSVCIGATILFILSRSVLGTFLLPRVMPYSATPLRYLAREWGMMAGLAVLVWLGVGLRTGFWVAPAFAAAVAFYALCWILVGQSLGVRSLLRLRTTSLRSGDYVPLSLRTGEYSLQASFYRVFAAFTPEVLWWFVLIGFFMALGCGGLFAVLGGLAALLRSFVRYTPFGALGSDSATVYWLYSLYLLALAGLFAGLMLRRARARYVV